jgi:Flp pilus assembly protein TadD
MSGGTSSTVEQLTADEIEPAPVTEALTRLRKAVEDAPQDPEAHRRLGLALRSTGRPDEAVRYAERAAELAPDDPAMLFSLGLVYSANRRLLDADASYRRVLEIVPDHAKAANNLGNIALRRGNESGAIDWYRQAVDSEPGYVQARHKLAGVLKYYGHLKQAYEVYETIVTTTAPNPREKKLQIDSLYNMGAINLSWSKPELAEEQLARVVLTVPRHRFAHYARGQALLELGRHDEAQQELQAHLNILHASGEGF